MKKLKLISLLVIAACFTKISAQTNSDLLSDKWGWYKIADKTVGNNRNRDDIVLTGIERYTAIKIIVVKAELNLYDLELYYAGGNGQVIAVITEMKEGNESKVFGLHGSTRDLVKIKFAYETLSPTAIEKTQIEVWGLCIIKPNLETLLIE